jgi:lambda family phage portal protein
MGGLIERVAPRWALKRQLARLAIERLYKAASPSNARTAPNDWRSGDAVMDHARAKLRQWGRHLDENHDLTHGILDQLSYQASRVEIEPRVLLRNGAPAKEVNDRLKAAWLEHRDSLDATGTLPWSALSALIARTWLRDGEVFAQHLLSGNVRYPGLLPYLIECHEPDLVPFDLKGDRPRVIHGIEVNGLGRPIAYHLYRDHPGDNLHAGFQTDTIRIPAEQITHLKIVNRLNQRRGASVLAPAVTRLADVSDYEESERLAAKVASSLCAAITRGADFMTTNNALDPSSGERPMELQAGVIFDNLMPGEKVEILDTNRPNTGLGEFRKSMLRAATSGIGVSYSSATHDYDGTYSSQRQELVESRLGYDQLRDHFCYSSATHDYDGTYSSQRQELVESRLGYDQLRDHFCAGFLKPVWRRFVTAAQLSGLVKVQRGDPETLFNAEFVPPPAPWIDPQREAKADEIAINAGIESRHGIIRKRGGDPARVDDEREADTTQAGTAA